MEAGLHLSGIPFLRNPERKKEKAFALLDSTLGKGAPFIMRTLTFGGKHWTVVYGKDNQGHYLLADPWLGLHSLGPEALDDRWTPREYDGFAIQ